MNKKRGRSKKGLSPVVATALLILIGVALAAIIFLWARSFVAEKLQKDVGGGAEAIELLCDDLRFDAEAVLSGGQGELDVSIVNRGNIPIYGAEARKESIGASKIVGIGVSELGIKSGEDYVLKIIPQINVQKGDSVTIVPVLLGTPGENSEDRKSYTCDLQYGIEAQVQ